jgi:hypothetical protein
VPRLEKKLRDEHCQGPFAESSMLVARYEALRGAFLGEMLQPDARAGLLLFLRRGMCGWARALATMPALRRPVGARPSSLPIPEEHRAVVHIFAAMVINGNHYGATP